MRRAVFGVGAWQVGITAMLLTAMMLSQIDSWRQALFIGLALSLSSTAMVLQVLKKNGELEARHGRLAFSVLLFQDLAAIPMIAFVGLLSVKDQSAEPMALEGALYGFAAIVSIALVGRYLLCRAFHFVAGIGISEATTAFGLLIIVVIEIIMKSAGLSAALGAFIAGALLADASYRHEIEANIKPFETLLLGLFFISIGMTLDLDLLTDQPGTITLGAVGLMLAKGVILDRLGRGYGLAADASRRFACTLAQGGEFAFVLTAIAIITGVVANNVPSMINVIVTVTMLATPVVLLGKKWLAALLAKPSPTPDFDEIPTNEAHVVIAGLGRFGQNVARIFATRSIPFTALDGDPTQIEVIRRFGGRVCFGDATRPEILAAARVENARAVVACIADVEASVKTTELVRLRYPDVTVFARARDRNHAHRLMALGVDGIIRETLLSAVEMSRQVLIEAGLSHKEAERIVEMFAERDQRRLLDDFEHAWDREKLAESARRHAEDLAELFKADVEKPG